MITILILGAAVAAGSPAEMPSTKFTEEISLPVQSRAIRTLPPITLPPPPSSPPSKPSEDALAEVLARREARDTLVKRQAIATGQVVETKQTKREVVMGILTDKRTGQKTLQLLVDGEPELRPVNVLYTARVKETAEKQDEEKDGDLGKMGLAAGIAGALAGAAGYAAGQKGKA